MQISWISSWCSCALLTVVGTLAFEAVLDDPRVLLNLVQRYPLLGVEHKQLVDC